MVSYVFLLCMLVPLVPSEAQPPGTALVSTVDRYHDIDVIDNYQWLEDFDHPTVREWNRGQSAYTGDDFDTIS